MEEYIIGPVFNLDFFYSPLEKQGEKVELIGVDWRFESLPGRPCPDPGRPAAHPERRAEGA